MRMFEITHMEREALIDLLVELQQINQELYMEIAEGLSILGYDEEPEETTEDSDDEDY